MSKIKELYIKYKEIFWYLVMGVATTLINIAAYWIFTHPLPINELWGTVLAWVVSVTFAYITNKIFVFESKTNSFKELFIEIASFFGARISTGALDTLFMFIFVTKLGFNDMLMKIISNVVVIILNYILSKIFVFKKKK